MKTTIEVIEDKDGGLFLAVIENGKAVHLYDGYEYLDAGIMLREILRALDGTEEWDGDSAAPAADYARLTGLAATKVIATADGLSITVFHHRLGLAGRRFAAREE
jgi:hypothetical protein